MLVKTIETIIEERGGAAKVQKAREKRQADSSRDIPKYLKKLKIIEQDFENLGYKITVKKIK